MDGASQRGETETEESWGSSAGRAEQVMERGRPAVTATGAKQATDHAQQHRPRRNPRPHAYIHPVNCESVILFCLLSVLYGISRWPNFRVEARPGGYGPDIANDRRCRHPETQTLK